MATFNRVKRTAVARRTAVRHRKGTESHDLRRALARSIQPRPGTGLSRRGRARFSRLQLAERDGEKEETCDGTDEEGNDQE